MHTFIGEITEIALTVTTSTTNDKVDKLFNEHPSNQGIVVVENDIPIALITRTNFYQKLGTLYGYNIYMGRSVKLLMNTNILIFDYSTSIFKVSELAMERKNEHLYDHIVVAKHNQYYGVVSIQKLLMTLAQTQSKIATNMNPLTGLPGNQIISEKLQTILNHQKYTVLYIDLDNFKTYNDVYGFSKGDNLIQETALLLKKYIHDPINFLGHIGGDDFLAILYHHDIHSLCGTIINEFDYLIRKFYSTEHLTQGYITSENRSGTMDQIPLVSVSIAAVSNKHTSYQTVEEIVAQATQIKKRCKQLPCSCYFENTLALP
ncbi:GGDEF domain-containing protein [Aquibacillus rhizosphaerae]|uniref:GGDEF domain-containing protein n=1 Tax=Aquibacillus rhizosphaerae TaxID=3051431 RepID=A0ABT7L894_9BACI|nr:GGDEF domain-containing protein [Aquibacillus sp. LR5S19]MDL4842083.1 GGDEF domain-containing protein [Aquibacillus sp. LR5S19]